MESQQGTQIKSIVKMYFYFMRLIPLRTHLIFSTTKTFAFEFNLKHISFQTIQGKFNS